MSAATAQKPHPSASLYVGDLAPDVTEGMLFEIFNQVGPVASIRVCRDAVTRRSLGYAYVNFHSVVDAERALDTLNNTPVKGRPCRIMWSQRDPSVRKSGAGNIFIKNLDPEIGAKELHDTFSAFGNILSCKVSLDENGQSKGYGFVHFESESSAKKAISKVNGMIMGSKTVYVGPFVAKKERLKKNEHSWTNVYVKNLDPNTSVEDLTKMFEKFGSITSAYIQEEDGESKGFGFINFEKHEDAKACVADSEEENMKNQDGVPLYVGRAQKKSERKAELQKKFELLKVERMTKYQGINLYIKNIEDTVDEERLKKEFAPFGTIKSVKIMTDDKGNNKGFGFVCFSTPEEAQHAITEMNGRILQGCGKPLYVNMHEPKEVRRQKLAAQHAARAKGRIPVGPGAGGPVYGMPGFYPGGNHGMPSVVYPPQQMIPRARGWGPSGPPQAQGYPMPPYNMVNPGMGPQRPMRGRGHPRGGRHRGGASGSNAGGRGGNAPPEQNNATQNQSNSSQQQQQDPMFAEAPLTLAQLNAFPADRHKLIIGEKLYPLVHKKQPVLAGKITGMLLDSGYTEELLGLLENEEALDSKIQEAVRVLEEAKKEAEANEEKDNGEADEEEDEGENPEEDDEEEEKDEGEGEGEEEKDE